MIALQASKPLGSRIEILLGFGQVRCDGIEIALKSHSHSDNSKKQRAAHKERNSTHLSREVEGFNNEQTRAVLQHIAYFDVTFAVLHTKNGE